ncbi:diacylglycerol kinase [Anaerosporomusa subterranea]|jgi:diacylglycerol kinase|uniref:Diacylglycerol kinase n=1 Tax=Anaerosporomusa subterranea TaxID=1794912 RepID=A0A154BSX4_ANASB|nr:diacylglycerol kinase family protein [Anaerosporomusa subterranea]KYZ77031.1 diacylglycerol kinase [Anaerosporomusa subterranea]
MRRTFFHSFQYAWQGVVYCLKTQRNMRIHLLMAISACGLGWRLGLPAGEMAVLLLTIGLVIVAELLNTAVEKLVDLTCPHYHPLAKAAKDTAAGAVLAAAIIALAVGYYLFVPRLF